MAKISTVIKSAIESIHNKAIVNKELDLDGLATRRYLRDILELSDRQRERALLEELNK